MAVCMCVYGCGNVCMYVCISLHVFSCMCDVGRGWHSGARIGRVNVFRPKGHGFDSHSSRHVWTLSSSGLEEAL